MDPEIQKRFKEFDERLRRVEYWLLATGNPVRETGYPSLIETQVKLDALLELDARVAANLREIAEIQKQTHKDSRDTAKD